MANGKIKADTLEHSTAGSLDTSYVVNGSAKAWVNFDGTASGAAARDSFGVSSMDDNGTGDYDVNFSSSMSNDDYSQSGSSSSGAVSGTDTWINAYAWATGYVSVGTNNSSQNLIDRAYVNVNVHGDLA